MSKTKSGSFEVEDQTDSKHKGFSESTSKIHRPLHTPTERNDIDMIFWGAILASQVAGIICLILVIYWCFLYGGFAWDSNPDLQFFYHPLLMVLGLIFFYGDAIILYRALSFLPKPILKILHAAVHMGAIVFSSIGLAAVFENHRRTNKADLYSLHSWVGLTTYIFFCLQYVGSFITFLFPGLPLAWRGKIMPFHTFFGVGIFVMAIATAQMGLTERLLWTTNYTTWQTIPEGAVGNSLGIFLIVFGFLIVFLVTHSTYKRQPLPSEVAHTVN